MSEAASAVMSRTLRRTSNNGRTTTTSLCSIRRISNLCLLLILPVIALVLTLQSMGQISGDYTLLLSTPAENWLAATTTATNFGQSRATVEDRAWEREKKRRRIIRERLRKRQEQDIANALAGNASTAQSQTKVVQELPKIPSSGQFDWHSPPLVNAYTLPDPRLYTNDTMVVIVLSARANFERRAVIRDTWAFRHAVYFVIGAPVLPEHASIQHRLLEEQAQYSDIIDSRHPDLYSGLPFKVRYAYQYISTRLPRVDWIVKVDDDTMVRVDSLQNAFLRSFNPNIPMVIGKIVERSAVAKEGKWRETRYPGMFYPFWPQGSCGHVVSRVVARYIAGMAPGSFTYYQGEDVSIGIWLDQAPADELEPVTWIHSKYFSNDAVCLKHDWLIMGHELSPDHIRACYQAMDEWPVEELTHKNWNYWAVETLKWAKDNPPKSQSYLYSY